MLRDSFRFVTSPVHEDLQGERIHDILKSKDGFWWIGSTRGLEKFDGTSLEKVNLKTKDGRPINVFIITHIMESEVYEDVLLMITQMSGIVEYNRKTGIAVHHMMNLHDSTTIQGGTFYKNIVEEKNGDFWVTSNTFALNFFDRNKNRFFHFRPTLPQKIPNIAIAGLLGQLVQCPVNPDFLWMNSRFGLYRFDKQSTKFTLFPYNTTIEYGNFGKVLALLADEKEQILWVGSLSEGLKPYDPKTGKEIRQDSLITISRKQEGYLENIKIYKESILGIGAKIAEFDRASKTFNRDYSLSDFHHSLRYVSDLETDEFGDIWLAGVPGLYRFTKQKHYAKSILYSELFGASYIDQKIGNKSNQVLDHVFSSHNDRLYMGTKNGDGVLVYEIAQDSFWALRYQSGAHSTDVHITSLCEDEYGRLWIGTQKNGLLYYDIGQEQIHKIDIDDGDPITTLAYLSPHLYIGIVSEGIIKLNVNNLKKEVFLATTPSKLFFDKDKQLWIGSYEGIQIFDPILGEKLAITEEAGGGSWLNDRRIIDILQAPNEGVIYLTTLGNGLISYHPQEKKWQNYQSEIDQFNFQTNMNVKPDGKLIINSGMSILEFDPSIHNKAFTELRRIPQGIGMQREIMTFPDGRVWGGRGSRTLQKYDFSSFKEAHSSIPLYIKKMLIGGKEVYTSDFLTHAESIELSHRENTISIEPGAINFALYARNHFYQKLEGVDEDWVKIRDNDVITYSNLAHGKYRYLYKASDQSGRWTKEVGSLDIIIHPPWWQSDLAYLVYFALILGALVFARRQILQRERLKNSLKLEQIEKEKVQEIDQLRARFFANISHEFRTPLTLIKAPLEDLLMSKKNDDERITFLQMHQNTERLLHLVNQLLDLSRLEAGMLKLQAEPTDVYSFLRQLAGNFESLALQKQIDFQVEVPNHQLLLTLDRDKLEKIVLNLLSNAFKFTPKNGWIKVEVHYIDQLQIKVGNSGIPIPENEQQKIFERFYQAGDTRHQGDGVGLALVKELVGLQQGEIGVESEAAKGTWFWVNLPLEGVSKLLAAEEKKHHTTKHDLSSLEVERKEIVTKRKISSPEADAGRKENVTKNLLLIVEDHPAVRDYISAKLKNQYQIITAENGAVGFEKATQQIPDLIISDVMMPVMDGVQFCQKIKNDHRTDHIPVILLTAKADIESRLEGLRTGADDYLAKPFNSRELRARCSNLIQQRQKLKERFQRAIHIAPSMIEVDSAEARFLKKAIKTIEQYLDDSHFTIALFAQNMQLSRTQLHRKLKAIAGMNATDFVRNFRLERAAQLLEQKSDSVSQIAYQVGFDNLSYFAKCFKEKYGRTPSDYKTNL